MTRIEAAQICQSVKFILENSDYTEAVEEALDMAIEALEQEPSNKRTIKHTETHACDCISRQDAIEAVHSYFKDKLDGLPTEETEEGYEVYCDVDKMNALLSDNKYLAKRIENLPSAQPFTTEQIQTMQELEAAQIEKAYELGKADRPKWIPCSERLPDTYDDMLVTDGESMAVGSYRDDADAWDNYNFGWLENLSEPPHGIKTVIAWMPLPEIYREDGEKE